MIIYGCVWKCCVPHCTQWFCWSLSLWKMAISLGIYPTFSDIPMWVFGIVSHEIAERPFQVFLRSFLIRNWGRNGDLVHLDQIHLGFFCDHHFFNWRVRDFPCSMTPAIFIHSPKYHENIAGYNNMVSPYPIISPEKAFDTFGWWCPRFSAEWSLLCGGLFSGALAAFWDRRSLWQMHLGEGKQWCQITTSVPDSCFWPKAITVNQGRQTFSSLDILPDVHSTLIVLRCLEHTR